MKLYSTVGLLYASGFELSGSGSFLYKNDMKLYNLIVFPDRNGVKIYSGV
jgi:hypothetical protein